MDVDKRLQHSVMRELKCDTRANAAHLAVSAKDGAVTLSAHLPRFRSDRRDPRSASLDTRSGRVTTTHGHVHSLREKQAAEEAAATAPGVAEGENSILVTP